MPKKQPRSLRAAVNAGDLASVQSFVAKGADIHKLDSGDGLTPLARAVNEQHIDIVRALLDAGANADRGGVEVPLGTAAHLGNLELVELLLQAGADPNRSDEDDHGPLMGAKTGPVAERLIQAGARVDVVDEDGNNEVLMHAAYCGREEVFVAIAARLSPEVVAAHQPFLEEGIRRRNRQDDPRGTAFVLAAQAGKLNIVQAMLADGVDVDTPIAANDDTALARAIYFGNDDVVETLLSAGANPNAGNETHETPFQVAIHRSPSDMVSRLLKAGADVRAQNIDGKPPLEQAVYFGRADLIDLLIDAGADQAGRSPAEWRRAASAGG